MLLNRYRAVADRGNPIRGGARIVRFSPFVGGGGG